MILRGGDHILREPLEFNDLDSGAPETPFVIRSYSGERARILGGVEILPDAFERQGDLLTADLGALGLNATVLGGGGVVGLKAELFAERNGTFTALPFAQHPNPLPHDIWTWVGYDNITAVSPDSSWFVINDTQTIEHGHWLDAARSANGLRLLGHWGNMFDFDAIRVLSIRPLRTSGQIKEYNVSLDVGEREERQASGGQQPWHRNSPPARAALAAFKVVPGVHFVAVDALELLDAPGEYWIDRDRSRLYVRHEGSPVALGKLFLTVAPLLTPDSSLKHPRALIEMSSSKWVTWSNVTFGLSSQSIFTADDVQGLVIEGCHFTGAGANGVRLAGVSSTLRDSEIAQCGNQGIELVGGNWDRYASSLFQSANLSVSGNTIWNWARWQRVPQAAGMTWSGVGHVVRRNVFRDSPSPAVQAGGNVDCLFEENVVTNVNYEQIDMGAYYHGSSAGGYELAWTQPGNVIRRNVFHTIRFAEQRPTEKDWSFTTQAVYLDDEQAAYTISANIFSSVDVGVLIGGGVHHKIINNSFDACSTACIHIDNRGMNWAHELCGCYCAFGNCAPGCQMGGGIGPGLSENLTADDGTFRFEQGIRKLRCVGPDASPPCATRADLWWLQTFRDDVKGGGTCAPAHNTIRSNRFDRRSVSAPWQVCGNFSNASHFHHACAQYTDPNVNGNLAIWGSEATDNIWVNGAPEDGHRRHVGRERTVPVMPWVEPDQTSPVSFAPWLVNFDIWYYSNASLLQTAIDRSDPDIFEWDFGTENNRQHELTRRGILVSSHQSFEWQQTSGAPDAHPRFARNFKGNGYGVAEDGLLEPMHPDRANLSFFMSQVAPKWHALTMEGNVRAVKYGQSVTQDNVGNYYGVFQGGGETLPQGKGFSWGPWINARFVTFYESQSCETVLQRAARACHPLPPLPNGSAFRLIDYVAQQRLRLTPLQLTRDPILHEYIRFAQNATVGQFRDMRRAAKLQAAKEVRPFPVAVYGNLECMAFRAGDACGWQQNRMNIMAAQWMDVILLEAAETIAEFKVALAAGNFEKPVFPYPDICPDACEAGTAIARALGATPEATSSHARWYGEHRELLMDRRSVADFAVVLDLPVFFWRGFSSLAVPGDAPHVLAMQNITALLDEVHVTYDVLLHGHADFYDDHKQWARLHSYRTLVLPRVEAVSDAHVERIREFALSGGRVVVLGDTCGMTDEEDAPRMSSAFEPLRQQGLLTWVNSSVLERFQANRTGPERRLLLQLLATEEEPMLSTALPAGVATAAWLHGSGPMLSVQLASTDKGSSASTSANEYHISVRLDESLFDAHRHSALEARFYSWSGTAGPYVELAFVVEDGRLNVSLPTFTWYGALVLATTSEADVRAITAQVRKLEQRLLLASTVTPGQAVLEPERAAVLRRAQALLDLVQGPNSSPVPAPAAASLMRQLNASRNELAAELDKVGVEAITFQQAQRAAISQDTSALFRISFGSTSSRLAPGWQSVGPHTLFDSSSGQPGWIGKEPWRRVHSGPAPSALRQGKMLVKSLACPFAASDAVLCSYLFSNSSERSTLKIALPQAGNYTIEIAMGEPSAMVTRVALTHVWSESGDLLGVGERLPGPGELATVAFPVSVPSPSRTERLPTLSLAFGGMANTPFFQFDDRNDGERFLTMSWLANTLLVRHRDAELSPDAAESLRAHEVAAAGLREWLVLGPLDDSNATCMEQPSAAERSLNLSASYPRKGGGVAGWVHAALDGPLAYLDLERLGIRDGDGLGALTLALTHIWLPGNMTRKRVLKASTTGVGVASLNGVPIFRDELNVGLTLHEERVEVELTPGWNALLVRSCTKWETPSWGLWAALTNVDDDTRPTEGTVSACGPHCSDGEAIGRRPRETMSTWRQARVRSATGVPPLLLPLLSAALAPRQVISSSTRTMNASRLGWPLTLPVFGGYSGSAASPIVPPLGTALSCSDSCPDDIIQHQIQIESPTLPYRPFNDYDCGGTCGRSRAAGTPRTLPTLLYETDTYRATFFPQYGGKLASLYHKPSQRELLFDNPVWQPGQLARLNAWTSGGIEWNWPRHGHTVFHMQPLWAVEVDSPRGPLLRLFEFDREMNTTFQVDLWAPAGNADDLQPFYAHIKVYNPNDHAVDAYWWTNIAAPLSARSRVAYTDSPYAIVSGGSEGLALVPFPHFSENVKTLSPAPHANPSTHSVDHSYPSAYYAARENFIRANSNGTAPSLRRALMGIVDTGSGLGTLHAQSTEIGGRKFWAWGNDWNDLGRMFFLSSCASGTGDAACSGSYLEMQAGVAPTQDQSFRLEANGTREWTEAWGAWSTSPAAVSGAYADAVGAAASGFGATPDEFEATDAWLQAMAQVPPSRVLSKGSAYGKLHELLTGEQLLPALSFDAADLNAPEWRAWHELLTLGTFSNASLAEPAPPSFMVDTPWLAKVYASAAAHQWTWLHHLHAGIAERQHGDASSAAAHFHKSATLRPNVVAYYCLGDLRKAWSLAASGIGPTASESTIALARDAAGVLADGWRQNRSFEELATLLAGIQTWPAQLSRAQAVILGSQPMRIAEVALELYHRHRPQKAIEMLLDPRAWAVSTEELVPLWYDSWYAVEGASNALEQVHVRQRHPPPPKIDFRGAT